MQFLFHIVTEDFLIVVRALLLEILRLASAAHDAVVEIVALVLGK